MMAGGHRAATLAFALLLVGISSVVVTDDLEVIDEFTSTTEGSTNPTTTDEVTNTPSTTTNSPSTTFTPPPTTTPTTTETDNPSVAHIGKQRKPQQQKPKESAPQLTSARGFLPTSTSTIERCFGGGPEVTNGHLSTSSEDHSRAVIEGLYSFSISMLKSLHNFESKEHSTGLLLSPFGIWSALVVTQMGTLGQTDLELRRVLGISSVPKSAVGMAYQGLRLWYRLKKNSTRKANNHHHHQHGYSNNGGGTKSKKLAYSVANKIFLNRKLTMRKCISEHFSTEVEPMDFADEPEACRKAINGWVERETGGKIQDLIGAGAINSWTNLIIANAVYFHAQWLMKFEPEDSARRTFHVSPTEELQVSMMKQTGTFMYGISESLKATILELPYASQDFAMLVILPDVSRGLDSLLRQLEPEMLHRAVRELFDDEIQVVLPKWKMEQEFELAGPLYSMGVKHLFDPRFSDLSGFFAGNRTNAPGAGKPKINVNSVVHKSYISVDEEGTEAAAATSLLIARSGRPAFPTQFVVNRPFLYLIRDTATNVILFMGTVRRPQQ